MDALADTPGSFPDTPDSAANAAAASAPAIDREPGSAKDPMATANIRELSRPQAGRFTLKNKDSQ